jgi:hypothetical protein
MGIVSMTNKRKDKRPAPLHKRVKGCGTQKFKVEGRAALPIRNSFCHPPPKWDTTDN